MIRKYLSLLRAKHLAALDKEKGQSIIIFTFAFLGLIAMLGLALDLGLVYVERVKMGRTTDATTLAAVVELPYEQDAMTRAIEYIQLNGYDVGVDTEILVRGCVISSTTFIDSQGVTHIYNAPAGGANVAEPGFTNPISFTTQIVGAPYITATQSPPRAVFVIDTGSYQAHNNDGSDDQECNRTNPVILGTANKLHVSGRVNVRMNFMQFFGFGVVPVQDEAIAENITSLDVIVVFDISGSMEDQTICHDCWVRTSYDPDYPNNGYFNPLPYNRAWNPGGNQSIPLSSLCVEPPNPYITNTSGSNYSYLAAEAELYSSESGNWDLGARTPGQGFWVIQRGSQGNTMPPGVSSEGNPGTRQGNQAGNRTAQSSNVCNPAVAGVDCVVAGDNICSSADGGIAVDCSAYISARPFISYGQRPGNIPNLTGAAYNADCFPAGPGPHPDPPYTGQCWGPASNPFWNTIGFGPSNVPWVEYDFTPSWNGNTQVWLRAIGGGLEAYNWAGSSPDQLDGTPANNLSPWRKAIYWQVGQAQNWAGTNGAVNQSNDGNLLECCANANEWRDNRAENGRWRWIKLGATATLSGTQYTLRLYQGSAGYKVDKLIFTNDPTGSSNNPPAAMLIDSGGAANVGPPASEGSATREACNVCNPAFGYTVNVGECTCRRQANDLANGGFGSGTGCTDVLSTTNQLVDNLYSGLQPLRSAQEAVKNFAGNLDPKFDQLGIVAFTSDVESGAGRRSKLQCITWATEQFGSPGRCFDPTQNPITYTHVLSAVETQWPTSGTNIAEGMREGLEELGVAGYALDSACTAATNDGHACDRRGAARRVLILMTDGSPNDNPGTCAPGGGRPDLWNGILGPSDDDFECAMYFAWQAANNNVTVYTIGIGAGANGDLLTAMATGYDPGTDTRYFTGSGQFFPAAKPTDLDAIFDAILDSIYVRIVG